MRGIPRYLLILLYLLMPTLTNDCLLIKKWSLSSIREIPSHPRVYEYSEINLKDGEDNQTTEELNVYLFDSEVSKSLN